MAANYKPAAIKDLQSFLKLLKNVPFSPGTSKNLRSQSLLSLKFNRVILTLFATLVISIQFTCRAQPMSFDSMYNIQPLQGSFLSWYDSDQGVANAGTCAMRCTNKWTSAYSCLAFSYDPSARRCDYYEIGLNMFMSSNIQVYNRQVTGRFQPITWKTYTTSIYLSAVEDMGTYEYAKDHCRNKGGYLLEFPSLEMYEALKLAVDAFSGVLCAWVGARYEQVDSGTSQWLTDRDESPLDNTTWLWSDGEPDLLSLEKCATYCHLTRRLTNINCLTPGFLLCQRDV